MSPATAATAFTAPSSRCAWGSRPRERELSISSWRFETGVCPRFFLEVLVTDAVIVSTARTPLAKSWRGAFNMTHGAKLAGHAARHAIERAGVDPAEVEDVIMGCAHPEGATGPNMAR